MGGVTTHGLSRTPEYRSWYSMKERCFNTKHPCYHLYGGRGITICERWMSITNFYADMGDRPEGTSLDRIDSDKNYEPENCRWATREEQAINTRRSNRLNTRSVRVQQMLDAGIDKSVIEYSLGIKL